MRKILCFICAIFIVSIAHADNATINWYVGDSVYDTTTCTIGGDINLPTAPNVPGHTFLGWKPTHAQIEYLESTGTQYMDTGFYPNNLTSVQTKITVLDVQNGNASVFGGAQGYKNQGFEFFIWNQKAYFSFGQQSYPIADIIHVGDTIELNWNKNVVEYRLNSNNKQIVLNNSTFQSPLDLFVFRNHRSTDDGYVGIVRMYYFKIYDNYVLVRDMIPVLDINGVACMYDKVSNTFFYNSGTGDFIAGPIITE